MQLMTEINADCSVFYMVKFLNKQKIWANGLGLF